MKTPGDEQGLAEGVVVRQAASVNGGHLRAWGLREEFLKEVEGRLPIGRRMPSCPTGQRQVDSGVRGNGVGQVESGVGQVRVGAVDGYRVWAAQYDEAPNALLALEMRVLSERIGAVGGSRILDAGSGTGRWMQWAAARGARVFGIDGSREMLQKAERKPGVGGRSALADIRSIPLRDDAVDLALCCFTIGYLPSPTPVFRELARVARQVIVSDLHPDAARAGWTRSFRAGDKIYEIVHYDHSIAELDDCARSAGLTLKWRAKTSFGEPEREVFRRAGKKSVFDKARLVPAVLVSLWQKQSL